MRRGWFHYHFGWIRDDFNRMFDSLRRVETWITLALVGGFSLITWGILRLALRSDNTLRSLNPAMAFCREQDNASIGTLFFLGVFFVLCALACIGEFFNYLEAKRHNSLVTARRSLITMLIIGMLALTFGLGALLYLEGRCL